MRAQVAVTQRQLPGESVKKGFSSDRPSHSTLRWGANQGDKAGNNLVSKVCVAFWGFSRCEKRLVKMYLL